MLIATEILFVFLGLLIVIFFWGIVIYNRFVKLKQKAKEAWANVDTQLKRRYDLISNLVEVVRAYASYEKKVLEKVTQTRALAVNSHDVLSRSKAEGDLSRSLKSLFAVAENYPQLKASTDFQKLQSQLSKTEDKIQETRRLYNHQVQEYNTRLASFPDSLVAQKWHFRPMAFFKVESSLEKKVPEAKFRS